MKDQPLAHKIYFDEVYTAVARAVGYKGIVVRDLGPLIEELAKKFDSVKVQSAIYYLTVYEGQMRINPPPLAKVELRPNVRRLCFQLLGPAPESPMYKHFYEVDNPPEDCMPEAPNNPSAEILQPCEKPTLEAKPEENGKPKTKEEPKEELKIGEPGISLEGYASLAKEKNKRQLLCMLRDARKKLKHHGKRTFMGKEAKKEIAAAETELKARNLEIPAEGQETAAWDKK